MHLLKLMSIALTDAEMRYEFHMVEKKALAEEDPALEKDMKKLEKICQTLTKAKVQAEKLVQREYKGWFK
jgi:hypothetical protein